MESFLNNLKEEVHEINSNIHGIYFRDYVMTASKFKGISKLMTDYINGSVNDDIKDEFRVYNAGFLNSIDKLNNESEAVVYIPLYESRIIRLFSRSQGITVIPFSKWLESKLYVLDKAGNFSDLDGKCDTTSVIARYLISVRKSTDGDFGSVIPFLDAVDTSERNII